MHRAKTVIGVFVLLLLAATAVVAQQAAPTYYRTVQHLNVPADKEAAYLDFLRNNTRKIIQLGMKSSNVVSWTVLKLVYEGSPALDFNYVATTLYAGAPPDLSDNEQADLIRHATGMTMEEYRQHLVELRASKGSVLGSVLATVPGTDMQEGNFVTVSRWKIQPGQEAEFSDFAQSALLPLQVQNFKDHHHMGWSVGRVMFPAGGDAPFDATIAIVHKDLASAVAILSPDEKAARFAAAHPEESYEAFMDRDHAVRRLVRTELLKVIISEQASQQTSSLPEEPRPAVLAGEP